MSAAILLARLAGVRARGTGSWVARCPAHDDRTPSLSVRETDQGVILLHCFAGCEAQEVVEAVGLQQRDLFPKLPADMHRATPRRRPLINGWDAVRAVQFCLTHLVFIVEDLRAGASTIDDVAGDLQCLVARVHLILREARHVV